MKRITLAVLLMGAVPALGGEYHPVSWFKQHPAERKAMLHWCLENSGVAQSEPNCINASEADLQRFPTAALPSPSTTEFWLQDPSFLSTQLRTCANYDRHHIPMEPFLARECAAARAAAAH
jgi:hypothetical protein